MVNRPLSIEEICTRLRPILGKKIDQIYLKYKLSDKREERDEIERAISALYEKHLEAGLLQEKVLIEPPEKGYLKGDYPLGNVIYANKDWGEFGLNEKEWARHVCVTGMSGSGKTNFAFMILKSFIDHKKPFIAFDWKKSFRPLMTIDDEILCFTIGKDEVSNWFRININVPPKNVAPKEWIGILCDIINEAFNASFGVHKMLSETLDRAFQDFGVYKGSGNYPTWLQIKDRLEDMEMEAQGKRGRESEWLTSAIRIAHSMTFGPFGKVLSFKGDGAMDVEELLNKKVIFELNALNNSEKKFFCEFILTYIYKMKKASDEHLGQGFKSGILVDEAHNIFLKKSTTFMSESVTETVYRDIREYGIGLVCLDQHISKLSEVVVGNSATNVAFQQMLPDDIHVISGLMQLRDYAKYFSMLPVGEAIVKLASRHYAPFQVRIPLVELKSKGVADDFVKKRMQREFAGIKKIKNFTDNCQTDKLQEALYKTKQEIKKADPKVEPSKENEENGIDVPPIANHVQQDLVIFITQLRGFGYDLETIKKNLMRNGFKAADIRVALKNIPMKKLAPVKLKKEHIRFLVILKKKGPMGTTAAYKEMKLSPRKGNVMKDYLLDKGMVEVEEKKTEKGRLKLLKVSKKGEKFISSYI